MNLLLVGGPNDGEVRETLGRENPPRLLLYAQDEQVGQSYRKLEGVLPHEMSTRVIVYRWEGEVRIARSA
jgi:hypothetical protein